MTCPSIEALVAAWVQAFNSHDLDRHVELYTEEAMLFGSVDELQLGHEEIRNYFGALPPTVSVRNYPPPRIAYLDGSTAVTAAHVDFANGDQLLPYRLTWTVVHRDGDWKIAQHHGSPMRTAAG